MMQIKRSLIAGLLSVISVFSAKALAETIIIQSTTSTQNSGLYDVLLPQFEAETDIKARVVAVGTGQAIKNAARCDGDVLIVHAKKAEEEFINAGFGTQRQDLMYNDFILVGPKADKIGVGKTQSIQEALILIARANARFASRGDDSGTHKKELQLWAPTTVNVARASGTWYREMGAGMGATLNAAIGMDAYTLTDRATWIAFQNKRDHTIILEGDEKLYNQYGIISINPERCTNLKQKSAQVFIDWMTSEKGQNAIAAYQRDGQQLFFPNAKSN